MYIIADCGSTKIDWMVLDRNNEIVTRVTTRGYNAMSRLDKELTSIINSEAKTLIQIASEVTTVSFFGAGCGSDSTCERVRGELSHIFKNADCKVGSDMLAAAMALCGSQPGIACILGTGSNSCLFDGEKIVANVSPLGFILGDEGSGAVLGCKLLGNILKCQFSPQVIERFNNKYPNLIPGDVIEEVYRGVQPRSFLASFAPFLSENIDLPEIEEFVVEEFCRFFKRNIQVYSMEKHPTINFDHLPVHFTGSIAIHFQPQLRMAAERSGCTIGKVIKSPLQELISSRKN